MKETILLGTYTKKESKGIYQIELNHNTKKLENLTLVTKVENPTYLAENEGFLYAIDKYMNDGGVSVTDLAQKQTIQHVVKPGTPPAYITVNRKLNLVLDANYHEGQLHAYNIQNNHELALAHTFENQGSSVRPEQDGSHLHFVDFLPDGNLIACDLGTDQVFIFSYDDKQGFITKSIFSTPAGFGPRHVTFTKDGKFIYLVGELASSVMVLEYKNNQLHTLQTISTIDNQSKIKNGAAAIRISDDEKNLYVSNRGQDSLAVFKIKDNHTIELIQSISVEGSFPRDFALNQDNSYLVCANQNSDNVTLFKRNSLNGKLTLIQKAVYAPEAVCVHFFSGGKNGKN